MDQALHDELRARYEIYIDAFGESAVHSLSRSGHVDLSGLDFWQFPLFLIVGHPQLPVKFIPDLVTFQAFVTPSYKKLREDGWLGKGRISSFEVAAADDQMAIISVKGDRLNEQGAVLNSWDLSYLLVRRGGQWMQACVMDKGPNLPEPEELYRWAHGLLSI